MGDSLHQEIFVTIKFCSSIKEVAIAMKLSKSTNVKFQIQLLSTENRIPHNWLGLHSQQC